MPQFVVELYLNQNMEYTCIWDIRWPHYPSNLFHALKIWREPTMATEYFLVNNGGNGQAIKTICECFPQFDVVPTFAFIVES